MEPEFYKGLIWKSLIRPHLSWLIPTTKLAKLICAPANKFWLRNFSNWNFPAISSVKLELPVEILTLYFLPTCIHPFLGHPIVCRKRVRLLQLRIALLTGTWAHKPSPVLKEKIRGRIIITSFFIFFAQLIFPSESFIQKKIFSSCQFWFNVEFEKI